MGNLGLFQNALERIYKTERKSFEDSKAWLKSLYETRESEDLCFLPYYTNGGCYGQDYFIEKVGMRNRNGCYCTVNGKS